MPKQALVEFCKYYMCRFQINISVVSLYEYCKRLKIQMDDQPYGGYRGMVIKIHPIILILNRLKFNFDKETLVIPDRQGREIHRGWPYEIPTTNHRIILLSPRFNGVDARMKEIVKIQYFRLGREVLSSGDIIILYMLDIGYRLSVNKGLENNSQKLEIARNHNWMFYTRPRSYTNNNITVKVPNRYLNGATKINHKINMLDQLYRKWKEG